MYSLKSKFPGTYKSLYFGSTLHLEHLSTPILCTSTLNLENMFFHNSGCDSLCLEYPSFPNFQLKQQRLRKILPSELSPPCSHHCGHTAILQHFIWTQHFSYLFIRSSFSSMSSLMADTEYTSLSPQHPAHCLKSDTKHLQNEGRDKPNLTHMLLVLLLNQNIKISFSTLPRRLNNSMFSRPKGLILQILWFHLQVISR